MNLINAMAESEFEFPFPTLDGWILQAYRVVESYGQVPGKIASRKIF
jgi:hypothetical protein